MYTRWTSHLATNEEKERFKRDIYSAKSVLERIIAIVAEDKEQLDRSEENIKSYTVPNWDYLQAHRNGMAAYMREMQTLLNLDQQKGTINDPR